MNDGGTDSGRTGSASEETKSSALRRTMTVATTAGLIFSLAGCKPSSREEGDSGGRPPSQSAPVEPKVESCSPSDKSCRYPSDFFRLVSGAKAEAARFLNNNQLQTPLWLFQGTELPIERVDASGGKSILLSVCEPHNCGDTMMSLLFREGRFTAGRATSSPAGGDRWLGAPSIADKKLLCGNDDGCMARSDLHIDDGSASANGSFPVRQEVADERTFLDASLAVLKIDENLSDQEAEAVARRAQMPCNRVSFAGPVGSHFAAAYALGVANAITSNPQLALDAGRQIEKGFSCRPASDFGYYCVGITYLSYGEGETLRYPIIGNAKKYGALYKLYIPILTSMNLDGRVVSGITVFADRRNVRCMAS